MEAFGAFAGWQTAALKAHRKSLLWPWPWGACWGSCLRVKVWRVWKRTRSTPAVVPGAAPALAKAGVGGYIHVVKPSHNDG